jgi:hypothetical protein
MKVTLTVNGKTAAGVARQREASGVRRLATS